MKLLLRAVWMAVFLSFPASIVLGFDAGQAGFEVRCGDVQTSLRLLSIPVQPGERVEVRIAERGASKLADFTATTTGGTLTRRASAWTWQAPQESGFARTTIFEPTRTDSIVIQWMITEPIDPNSEYLGRYRIGTYPSSPLRGLSSYKNPRGLIRVEKEDVDLQISPHFKLGQFLCKQEGGFPKYVLVRPRLLMKLERILDMLNGRGINVPTLVVMSGYRTPFYNQAIGNVKYSRHVFGDAADVYVDVSPVDGNMDDLNGDGKVDRKDSETLAAWIEELTPQPFWQRMVGGLGIYKANAAHGPFVHVDTRGSRARW